MRLAFSAYCRGFIQWYEPIAVFSMSRTRRYLFLREDDRVVYEECKRHLTTVFVLAKVGSLSSEKNFSGTGEVRTDLSKTCKRSCTRSKGVVAVVTVFTGLLDDRATPGQGML